MAGSIDLSDLRRRCLEAAGLKGTSQNVLWQTGEFISTSCDEPVLLALAPCRAGGYIKMQWRRRR